VGVTNGHMLDRTGGREEKKSLAKEKSNRSSESHLVCSKGYKAASVL